MKLNIEPFDPCEDGLKYYESKASFEEAWNDCPRGDWMLWLVANLEVDDSTLTRAVALCADTVRYLMEDKRSAAAVDAALMYADGKISREELKRYARAAYYAGRAARWVDYRSANRLETAAVCREILTEAVFEKVKQLNNKES